jgi:hypothetical protein
VIPGAARVPRRISLHLEKARVCVELEIGLSDVKAFRNLLSDDIYEKL